MPPLAPSVTPPRGPQATPTREEIPQRVIDHTVPVSPRVGLFAAAGANGGAYADAAIRIGPAYQASIPEWCSGTLQGDELEGRADEYVEDLQYTPLTEPPPPLQSLQDIACLTDDAPAAAASAPAPRPTTVVESFDLDENGLPELPDGCSVGQYCLAMGSNAGEHRKYKAMLMGVRAAFPPVLVRYIGTADGSTNVLLLPSVAKSFVHVWQVEPWPPPAMTPTAAAAADADGGAEGAHGGADGGCVERQGSSSSDQLPPVDGEAIVFTANVGRNSLRARLPKRDMQLVSEAGGFKLYHDPKRQFEGYAGTGYLGVNEDASNSGIKKQRPFVCVYEGKYHGRFETEVQAAVQYARLENGLPPMPAPFTGAAAKPNHITAKAIDTGGDEGAAADTWPAIDPANVPGIGAELQVEVEEPAARGGAIVWKRAIVLRKVIKAGVERMVLMINPDEEDDFIEEYGMEDEGTEWRWPNGSKASAPAANATAPTGATPAADPAAADVAVADVASSEAKSMPPPPPPPPRSISGSGSGDDAGSGSCLEEESTPGEQKRRRSSHDGFERGEGDAGGEAAGGKRISKRQRGEIAGPGLVDPSATP